MTKKIDRRKNYYMVIDTETTNGLKFPLVYDVGYQIVDKKGNVYEKGSYIVYEIFCKEKEKMSNAYYAEKLPQYEADITSGKRTIKTFYNIRKEMLAYIEEYRARICAYNLLFDKRVLNNTLSFITNRKYKNFFYEDTEFCDIWHMACCSILQQVTFDKMAYNNEWTTSSGNVKTSAEIAYRYLMRDADFEEAHTALEDVLIETELLLKGLRMRLTSTEMEVVYNPWRKPQPPYKKYVEYVENLIAG